MSSTQLQLVKWSFPTLAIILGFLWYKRRRADRVDPGGIPKLDSDTNANNVKVTKRSKSLCDSGIHTDDSSNLSTSCPSAVEIFSPRKVSSSLDIPGRKPSEPISIKSVKSIENNINWFEDFEEEEYLESRKIKLGSNPKSSCFEMRSHKRSPLFDLEMERNIKLLKVCDNIIEEDQVQEVNSTQEKITPEKKMDISDTTAIETSEEPDSNLESNEVKTQALSERDSANHSPVSGVLDGSLVDEARSEGSTDSGNGGSINGHSTITNFRKIYEFTVPIHLVGKLIGQKGNFLQNLKKESDVRINIKRFPHMRNKKICVIEGFEDEITKALTLIRKKFPHTKYPYFDMEPLPSKAPKENHWMAELMLMSLVEGVSNDVLVCFIVEPNRFFIHMPTHPTYPLLMTLDENITHLYDSTEPPPIPDELVRGMVFVAKLYNRWVRVYVEVPDPKGEHHLVRLVDHGGYWTISNADMRKIRSDFLTLPFQAIEVFLANVRPINGEWQQEAYDLVHQICSGIVGQAQIEGYIDSHTYISLYFNIHKHGVISLADELIARGYAEPATLEEVAPGEVLRVL